MSTRSHGQRNPARRSAPRLKNTTKTSRKKEPSTKKRRRSKKRSIPKNLRGLQKKVAGAIYYVLDTNVLRRNWDIIFKFEEHNVVLTSQIWREVDRQKGGFGSDSFNLRRVVNIIDSLISGKTREEIVNGIPLIPPKDMANGKSHTGKLYLDLSKPKRPDGLDMDLLTDEPDDKILMVCLKLKAENKRVVLVSNDANFRVRANWAGIEAEKYLGETASEMVGEEDIRPGFHMVPSEIWNNKNSTPTPIKGSSIVRYTFTNAMFKKVHCNQFLVFKDGMQLMVMDKPKPNQVVAETLAFHRPWGIHPRNSEQDLAIQLGMDERVRGLTLAGKAGSGKTYIALAVALELVFEQKLYSRIVITRPTVGAENDIGFMPGDEKDKMDPWMGGIYDNLEMLSLSEFNDDYVQDGRVRKGDHKQKSGMTMDVLMQRIKFKALNYMQGRNLNRTILLVDEAQNLKPNVLKMINTRVGESSKIILLGNVNQINDDSLTEQVNGVSNYIRAFEDSTIAGHLTLQKGERGVYATEAEERLK